MLPKKARYRLIQLHGCQGITRRTIQKILHHDPSLSHIHQLIPSEMHQLFTISMKHATLIYKELRNPYKLSRIYSHEKRYQIITIFDEQYPLNLRSIPDPPYVLYAIGNLELLHYPKMLSVIGTRKPSCEAKEKIKYIMKPLLDNHWLIVSGMAIGIDSLAHLYTLINNGRTIAVLGSGFEHVYPKRNISLFHQITEKGLIISEYPPEISPRPYHFPERNRIISGLSFGTLVIEATEKSGTLITVDQALDQGREVYAVPGSPRIAQTKGCHKIIQEGAKLVANAIDIEDDWISFGKEWLQRKL